MKTIHEIKDEVAADFGFKDWGNLCFIWAGFIKHVEPFMDIVSKRYAAEAIREAAERATAYNQVPRVYSDAKVDRQSILNLLNELK